MSSIETFRYRFNPPWLMSQTQADRDRVMMWLKNIGYDPSTVRSFETWRVDEYFTEVLIEKYEIDDDGRGSIDKGTGEYRLEYRVAETASASIPQAVRV